MAKGVFIHRVDSVYNDKPDVQYQFPRQYYSRAVQCVGDWIVYYEPTKGGGRGYYAIAKLEGIADDPSSPDMFLGLIQHGSFLQFEKDVPFRLDETIVEHGLLNEQGKISGRAQAAIRPISITDFNRIFDLGFPENDTLLPREGGASAQILGIGVRDVSPPFKYEIERDRVALLGTRAFRDRSFRRVILDAYDRRCAITGFQFLNGGGRAEVEAARIRPVEFSGPDIPCNGIALSGTVHWMFDRGLISLTDELDVLVSRKVNDVSGVWQLVNQTRRAHAPADTSLRPHPRFLEWHRRHHEFEV